MTRRALLLACVLGLAASLFAQPIPQVGTTSFANRYTGSLPGTCKAKAVALSSSYVLNICGPDNTWTAVSGGGGSGTVTSVAMTVPSFMAISGSPVTTSGTLALSVSSQSQNLFLASPNGSSGVPSFRALVTADVPTLNQSTTGNADTATLATTAANATNVATTQASTSASFFPLFVASSTNGNQAPRLGTGLLFNPSTNTLTATAFVGNLTGNVTGNASGTSGSTTGNAATATILATARAINGVNFDGSAPITVTAAAGTLSGATLAAGVTASSLTSVGTLANLTVTNPITGSVTGSSGSATGNAGTASAADHTPTACGSNTFAQSQSTAWSFTCASVSLAAAVSGILPGANGGTANGFMAFSGPASSLKTFTLPNVSATVLTDNAVVTVAQGGTGLATLTANNVLLGNGTSTPQFVAPGTSGNVLTSNGTTWSSSAPAAAGATLTTNTFTRTQTISPANNEPAITINRATAPVGTITTASNTTVVGSGTSFLSQVRLGDTITPSGQSARVVSTVTDDTHLTLTASASGTGSGLSYTLSALAVSINPNGTTTAPLSSPGIGKNSERYGQNASITAGSAAGDNSLAIGPNTRAAGNNATAIGSSSISDGSGSSGDATTAVGSQTNCAGGAAICIGYLAASIYAKSIVFNSNTNGGAAVSPSATGDIVFGTNTASTMYIGAVYAGGANAQAIRSPRGFGTDTAGSNLTLSPGGGTGAATGGNTYIDGTPTTHTTGATDNSSTVHRFAIPSKCTALTSGVASSLASITLPTLTMGGGSLSACVHATDGTDMQMLCETVTFAVANKGGTYSKSIGAVAAGSEVHTAGSALSNVWSLLDGTNLSTIQLTSTVTGITPSGLNSFEVCYAPFNNSLQQLNPI